MRRKINQLELTQIDLVDKEIKTVYNHMPYSQEDEGKIEHAK